MKKISTITLCVVLSLLCFLFIGNTKKVEAMVSNQGYWIDSNPNAPEDYAYSFAVIGDTQNLCRDYGQSGPTNLKYAQQFHGIYDWVLANKDSKKIKHVFGLGDITETHEWNVVDLDEWKLAKEAISKMDGKISYSLVRGNHDMSEYFNQTFNYPAYTNQFGGFFEEGDLTTSYMTMTIGVTDYLFITLNYGPSDEELQWAGEVIEAHETHKVIITTHGYTASNGNPLNSQNSDRYTTPGPVTDIDYETGRSYNDGDGMWEKLISKYGNIMLVMSGHIPCETVLKHEAIGNHDNKVIELLIDPQVMDVDDPTGMVCMLYFNEDGSKMDIEWYSTVKNKYYNSDSQYSVDLSECGSEAHVYDYDYDNNDHWLQCSYCDSYKDIEKHTWKENSSTGKLECVCVVAYA